MSRYDEALGELDATIYRSKEDPIYDGSILSSDGLHIILPSETVETIREALEKAKAYDEAKAIIQETIKLANDRIVQEDGDCYTYATTKELSKTLGFTEAQAESHERGVNAVMRRADIKVIKSKE